MRRMLHWFTEGARPFTQFFFGTPKNEFQLFAWVVIVAFVQFAVLLLLVSILSSLLPR
jgi:hypothetical protein